MNFYEHHLGDYAEATAHLSYVEDAAYARCIRKVYATEAPLPADIKAVQRLLGARTKAEKQAVETVLREFFTLEEDGWHNSRCDEELAKFRAQEPERELKRKNEDARVKKHREERSRLFAELATQGVHPHWNLGIAELRTLHERTCNTPAAVTGAVTSNVTGPAPVTACATPATASQSPPPTSHFPVSSQNPPTPLQGAEDAQARSGRKPRSETDASGRAWAGACLVIDGVKGHRDKTWADADAMLADPKATAAIVAIGGHRAIAVRDRYTQGELKRRFREHYEQHSPGPAHRSADAREATPEGEARDVAALAAGALKAVAQ